MKDTIIEEVRCIRDEHSKLFGYDLGAICEDYKSHHGKLKNRLVRLKPKFITAKKSPVSSVLQKSGLALERFYGEGRTGVGAYARAICPIMLEL